jgi:hypothetical protein
MFAMLEPGGEGILLVRVQLTAAREVSALQRGSSASHGTVQG